MNKMKPIIDNIMPESPKKLSTCKRLRKLRKTAVEEWTSKRQTLKRFSGSESEILYSNDHLTVGKPLTPVEGHHRL